MEGSKILIVHDDFELRSKLSDTLILGKYVVEATSSGKQAMDIVRSRPIDLLLCSVNVAEIDGFGVLRMVNKFMETAGIGFIMLLTDHDPIHARRAMELGADGYLMHPYDDGELLNQVEVRLRKKRFQHEFFLKQHMQFRTLQNRSDEVAWLRNKFRERSPRRLKKNQILYYPGDRALGLYYVLSGRIKTYLRDENGHTIITGIYNKDEYFGLKTVLLGVEIQESAEAIDLSEVATLPLDDVERMLLDYPDLARVFNRHLARKLVEREERLLEAAHYSVRKRIAKVILRLCQSNPKLSAKNRLKISRNDLASIVGIATETLSRVLSDFSREGLIEKDGNEIIVLALDLLKNMKN